MAPNQIICFRHIPIIIEKKKKQFNDELSGLKLFEILKMLFGFIMQSLQMQPAIQSTPFERISNHSQAKLKFG